MMVSRYAEKGELWEKVSKLVTETCPDFDTIDTMCAIVTIYERMLRVRNFPPGWMGRHEEGGKQW